MEAPAQGSARENRPLKVRCIGNRFPDEAPPRKSTPQAFVWESKTRAPDPPEFAAISGMLNRFSSLGVRGFKFRSIITYVSLWAQF